MGEIDTKISGLINQVKECARDVYEELGAGWPEKVYQQAMEVALRERGISYENQRILPISFRGHVIGEGIPDLVVWANLDGRRIAIVIDLKWEPYIKEDHRGQVAKYIQELKKQVKENEEVLEVGFVINFTKTSGKKVEEETEELVSGVQVLNVEAVK